MASCTMLVLLAVFALAFATEEAQQGAADKVVKMMAKLKSGVIEQGKKEDAEFKAYAKFCAKTKNQKAYQITRSEKKIASMDADKEVTEQSIAEATEKISELETTYSTDEAELGTKTAERADGAANYAADAKEITDAMSALDKAIGTLSAAKKDITALTGMQSIVGQVLDTTSRMSLLQVTAKQMSALQTLGAPKATYNFRPTEVVAMLKGLKSTFMENKQRLDMEEEVTIGEFNKLRTNLNNQMKFTKEDLDDKILFKSQVEGKKAELEKDLAAETKAMEADKAFKDDLEADCKAKDDMDKSKQKAREDEMEAIQTAIDHLSAGGVSFVQVESHTAARGSLKLKKTGSVQVSKVPAAFLQLRARRAEEQAKKREADMALLRDMAAKTGVAAASRVVERAASASDPFEKVRSLFSELLARMTEQASTEAANHEDCTEKIQTHTEARDQSNADSETLRNEITALDASLFKLNKNVKQLSEDISEATASLQEATAQRESENEVYESAKKEAQDGIDGSKLALDVMNDYYKNVGKKAVLLQSSGPKDSSGKEVHGMGPEVNMGDHAGEAHERSAGVLGMLEVLHSDFERTKTTLDSDEAQSKADFDALKTDLDTDITDKNEELDEVKTDMAAKEVQKDQKENALENAQEMLENAHEKLDALRDMCTNTDESYEERRRKRQEEIDHLETTVKLLNDMIAEGQ